MTHTNSFALIPSYISTTPLNHQRILGIASVFAGSLLLALTAQIYIALPFTPVPITGQTFGVALLALLWGRKKAALSFLLYLTEGALGLPVFAMGQSSLTVGPTLGYLVGMFFAINAVGFMADKGAPRNYARAFLYCTLGSAITLGCGLVGLSFFIVKEQLLNLGFFPFLPGDIIKNLIASSLYFFLTPNKE